MDERERLQRLEQAVLGIGTGNGLLREVRALRQDVSEGLDDLRTLVVQESKDREAQWSGVYRRVAVSVLGIFGSIGGGVIVALIVR